MTSPLSTQEGKGARGIETNGSEALTTSHLNKTRSLADVWADEATKPVKKPCGVPYLAKVPYAGAKP